MVSYKHVSAWEVGKLLAGYDMIASKINLPSLSLFSLLILPPPFLSEELGFRFRW
jgi:hypothetical protein